MSAKPPVDAKKKTAPIPPPEPAAIQRPAGAPAAPRIIGSRYVPLFIVRFQHGYYNASGGECPDFAVVPTPECAKLMTRLGMLFKDLGAGFTVLIDQSNITTTIDYVRNRFNPNQAGHGYWSWLSFLLIVKNSNFIGFTALPITLNPLNQNLHSSNLQTLNVGDELILGDAAGLAQHSLYPLVNRGVSIPTMSGRTATLADLSGAIVSSGGDASATEANFALGGLPYGFYSAAANDDPGATRASPTPYDVVYAPDVPRTFGLIDLVLTQPDAGIGDPAAFPIAPLFAPKPARKTAKRTAAPVVPTTIQPVTLVLQFAPRATYWRYFVVSQDPRGTLLPAMQITGTAATFAQTTATLPNGDAATVFTASTALPLQQQSPFAFTLTGQRQGAHGGRDSVSVKRLPAAPVAPVWPPAADEPLNGTSEIYVYV